MPVIAIIDAKGGSGATTLTAALADALALQGERVLAVDLDAHNELRLHLGMPWGIDDGLAPRLRAGQDWTEAAWRSPAGSWFLAYGRDTLDDGSTPWPANADWLRAGLADTGFGDDTWVLLDMPSTVSARPLEGQPHANQTLIVATPEPSAQARLIGQALLSGEKAEPLLVINRHDPMRRLHGDVLRITHAHYGDRLSPVAIPEDPRVPEALANNTNIVAHVPHSAAARRIDTLALWLKTRLRTSPRRLSA